MKKEVVLFEKMIKQEAKMRGETLTVRDFDFAIGGFITGLSFGRTEKELMELVRLIEKGKVAKDLGITGVEKESIIYG